MVKIQQRKNTEHTNKSEIRMATRILTEQQQNFKDNNNALKIIKRMILNLQFHSQSKDQLIFRYNKNIFRCARS